MHDQLLWVEVVSLGERVWDRVLVVAHHGRWRGGVAQAIISMMVIMELSTDGGLFLGEIELQP